MEKIVSCSNLYALTGMYIFFSRWYLELENFVPVARLMRKV